MDAALIIGSPVAIRLMAVASVHRLSLPRVASMARRGGSKRGVITRGGASGAAPAARDGPARPSDVAPGATIPVDHRPHGERGQRRQTFTRNPAYCDSPEVGLRRFQSSRHLPIECVIEPRRSAALCGGRASATRAAPGVRIVHRREKGQQPSSPGDATARRAAAAASGPSRRQHTRYRG
jgi:hypothetical protein